MKQITVKFNESQKKLYDDLFVKNMISQAFPEFVKDAYHNKIDEIRSKRNLDPKEIEDLTFEAVRSETRSSLN